MLLHTAWLASLALHSAEDFTTTHGCHNCFSHADAGSPHQNKQGNFCFCIFYTNVSVDEILEHLLWKLKNMEEWGETS